MLLRVRHYSDKFLRCFGILGIAATWLGISALCIPTVRPHFLSLLYRSLVAFTNFKGTTPWGFISFDLVQPVLLLIFFVVLLHESHGEDAVKIHWRKDGIIGLKAIGLLVVFYYLPIFLWKGTRIVWEDHHSLTQQIQAMEKQNVDLTSDNASLRSQLSMGFQDAKQQCEQAKDGEIKRLKGQLNAVCYQPDRRLTNEDRAVIFAALQTITAEQKKHNTVPSIRMLCVCQDLESSRFLNVLWPIFRNAGWTMRVDAPNAPDAEQAKKNYAAQQAWIFQSGYAEGVTVFDKDPKGWGWALSNPFYERGFGEMWNQRHTELPNVDGLTIWVGFKSTR